MKFGQLLDNNMVKVFLKNHTQNLVEQLFPEPFRKSQKWYLWINSLNISQDVISCDYGIKFYTVWFYCMTSWGLAKHIETKLQKNSFYLV